MNVAVIRNANPLRALAACGQSVWLDYIRRSLLNSGELQRLLDEDGLRGITSNPAIFEKAISGSSDYAAALAELRARKLDATTAYEQLAIVDIQAAADILQPLYLATHRRDGLVSLEVSPYLARDTQGTLAEARRLWAAVARENVMIKVPATPEGIPAVEQLIAEGINVNVTLLFAQSAYERVAEAYMAGLERYAKAGGRLGRIASVASFFISRIDAAADALLASRLAQATDAAEAELLQSLVGKVAIANAKLTYGRYRELFGGPRWAELAARGAQTQRLLWASTGTKNPAYRDVLYVEELIGPETVNTVPPATFAAFREHGRVRPSLTEGFDAARATMARFERAGFSMQRLAATLLEEGLVLFSDAFDKLLAAVGGGTAPTPVASVGRQTYSLPGGLKSAVDAVLCDWEATGKVRRLWDHDAQLWTGSDESKWLGWLGIAADQLGYVGRLQQFADDAQQYDYVLVLGMGGSSLAPDVLRRTFGRLPSRPELLVLDSTDPAQVRTMESRVDPTRTLFVVSSKSGSTLEPNILKHYFFDRVAQSLGVAEAANRFIAITDPRSALEQMAQRDAFRHVFHGVPSIGGRYSALSHFGMVPACAMGIDVRRFLERAQGMVGACAASVRAHENPGVVLGAILGAAAGQGRDKLTIISTPALHDVGAWLEQLIAESTGKDGKGIIPVDRERVGPPDAYGEDRLFVYLRLEGAADPAQDAAVAALERSGQPVVRIVIGDAYDLAQEFFRWEVATAVAGSIIGVNPFDQPDVEASKIATRGLTEEYERTGSLPAEAPLFVEDGIKLLTDEVNARALLETVGPSPSLIAYLKAHLGRLQKGDYFALLAYVEMTDEHEAQLQRVRLSVRDAKRVATCLGFGPRFQHSTGQLYKGGPNSGLVLQVTCDDAHDVPVPGQKYSFGVVKAAQARGDLAVLAERGRRVLRVHLGADVTAGLAALTAATIAALQ